MCIYTGAQSAWRERLRCPHPDFEPLLLPLSFLVGDGVLLNTPHSWISRGGSRKVVFLSSAHPLWSSVCSLIRNSAGPNCASVRASPWQPQGPLDTLHHLPDPHPELTPFPPPSQNAPLAPSITYTAGWTQSRGPGWLLWWLLLGPCVGHKHALGAEGPSPCFPGADPETFPHPQSRVLSAELQSSGLVLPADLPCSAHRRPSPLPHQPQVEQVGPGQGKSMSFTIC